MAVLTTVELEYVVRGYIAVVRAATVRGTGGRSGPGLKQSVIAAMGLHLGLHVRKLPPLYLDRAPPK